MDVISKSLKSPSVKSKFSTAANVVKNKVKMERTGTEYYPELTGTLLAFIAENERNLLESKKLLYSDTKYQLDCLTKKVINQLPRESSLEKVLEAHGWNGVEFESESAALDYAALKSALNKLYYTHIWATDTAPKLSAQSKQQSFVNLFSEDRLIGSFCPNLLFYLLSRSDVDLQMPKMLREKVRSPVASQRNSGVESMHDSHFRSSYSSHSSNTPSRNSIHSSRDSSSNGKNTKLACKGLSTIGACMLADISGFTKLSAKCCERGLEGLDDLHEATSVFLGQYVQIVYSFKGDVIAFAGDALICVFYDVPSVVEFGMSPLPVRSNEEILTDCCRRAVKCAIALTAVFTDELTSHVGISCGSMDFSTLGGNKNEWVFLLTGSPLHQLAACIDDATSKEVVVTLDVKDFLAKNDTGELVGEITESGNFLVKSFECKGIETDIHSRFMDLPTANGVAEHVRSFTPYPVLNAIECGMLDSISELRKVTTVFLKLDSYKPDLSLINLQSLFFVVQETLMKTGGFLRQFLVDDKGCVLIAMWGVPSFTHSDDAARAVSFALTSHSLISALGHSCSIGITTGNVYCGNIGSLVRRDFVGIGAPVNLSARLMSKAKGLIFLCETTYAGLPKAFSSSLKKSDGMKLKGYNDLMYAYVCDGSEAIVLGSFSSALRTFVPTMIAQQITKQVNKVSVNHDSSETETHIGSLKVKALLQPGHKTPKVSVTIIEGEAGCGKGAVGHAFANYSHVCKLFTIEVIVQAEDRQIPHALGKYLFGKLLGKGNFSDEVQQRSMLDKIFHSISLSHFAEKEEVAVTQNALLSALGLSWRIGEDETSYQLTAESKALTTVLFFLMAQRPCSISIIDAQFLDEASWYDLYLLSIRPLSACFLVVCNSMHKLKDHNLMFDDILSKNPILAPNKRSSFFPWFCGSVEEFVVVHKVPEGDRTISNKSSGGMLITKMRSIRRPPQTLSGKLKGFHHANGYGLLKGLTNVLLIEMAPLTSGELSTMIRHELRGDGSEFPPELIEFIRESASGNAYWCLEIAQFILERGQEVFLKSSKGSLATVVTCKIEKLSLEQQVILRNASVIGVEFSVDILKLTLPRHVTASKVKDGLKILVEAKFISQAHEDPPTYYFPNALIRDIVCDMFPVRNRSKIHLAIAEQVEGLNSHNLEPFFEILNYHFCHCESEADKAKGVRYCFLAVEKLLKAGEFENVLISLECTLSAATPEQCESLLKLTRDVMNQIQNCWQVPSFKTAHADLMPGSRGYLAFQGVESGFLVKGKDFVKINTANVTTNLAVNTNIKLKDVAQSIPGIPPLADSEVPATQDGNKTQGKLGLPSKYSISQFSSNLDSLGEDSEDISTTKIIRKSPQVQPLETVVETDILSTNAPYTRSNKPAQHNGCIVS